MKWIKAQLRLWKILAHALDVCFGHIGARLGNPFSIATMGLQMQGKAFNSLAVTRCRPGTGRSSGVARNVTWYRERTDPQLNTLGR